MIKDVQERLAEIKVSIDRLQIDNADQALTTCQAYCNQLLLDGTALGTTDSSDEDKRDMIVSMRTAIHKLQDTTDELMTQTAEAYRSHIGSEEKEAFERLSSELQMEYNADAYRCFKAFHDVSSLHDLLSRLNSGLLDTGYELEKQSRPAPSATAEEIHSGAATADTDPLRYDNDPVPGSLSP